MIYELRSTSWPCVTGVLRLRFKAESVLPNTETRKRGARVATAPLLICLLAFCLTLSSAHAFPAAPHHILHGTVRDEHGAPLSLTSAQVFLETSNGISLTCRVSPGAQPGENYRLIVPVDSFTTPDPFKSTALRPTTPFRLKVKIDNTTYLPIEMAGNPASLGEPAGSTLINLTLGVDSIGDGLPDAWKNLVIAMLGGGLTLADITPNGIAPNGMTYYANYIAGTYAWDPQDALKLSVVGHADQGPIVQFFGVAGHTYSIQGTTNLVNWAPMTIRAPGNTSDPGGQTLYNPSSQVVATEIVLAPGQPKAMFFRIRVH